jgi:hypothetical protein
VLFTQLAFLALARPIFDFYYGATGYRKADELTI